MQKQKLLSTLAQYTLGGNCSSVKWKVEDNTLKIHFLTEDGAVRGYVECEGIEMPDCEFGIYDSDKFKQVLGALESNISMAKERTLLSIADETIQVNYILSPLEIIFNEQTKDPEFDRPFKDVPAPNLKFALTPEVANKFIKAKNALPESLHVAVQAYRTVDSDIEFILNYSTHPTTQIKMNIVGEVMSDLPITAFSADYLKEIFLANKDFETGEVIIYSKEIDDPVRGTRIAAGMDVDFRGDGFTTKYRLAKIELVN